MTDATLMLGGDAVTGDGAVMRAVATHLRTVSANVDTVREQLRDQSAAGWSGDAADAFRGALEEIPGELCKLTESYDAAATTVSDYAGRLEALRATSDALAGRIAAAESRRTGELAAKTGAQRDVAAATQAHVVTAADPAAHATTRAALDRASSMLASAKASIDATGSEIAALRREAHDNRLAFEDAVKACRDGLDAASDAGIRNSLGTWYDRHIARGGPIGTLFDSVIVAPFRDTVEALKAFIDDPSLNNLSALLGGVGDVLALVGCVLLLAALGLGSGGMAFALGGLLLVGSRAATFGKAGVDVVRARAGEPGAVNDLADDAIGLVVPGAAGKGVVKGLGGATRGGVPKRLVGASEQLARQQAKHAQTPTPWSQGWVTRPSNVVQPLAVGEQAAFVTDEALQIARPSTWASGAVEVSGATCPAPGPLLSSSTAVRHPIAVPAR